LRRRFKYSTSSTARTASPTIVTVADMLASSSWFLYSVRENVSFFTEKNQRIPMPLPDAAVIAR
jgi:hypothetical protein